MSEYLHIKDIHKDFSGLKVLTGVDFTVREKERHAVIGPNGAGKTTLFNIISGKFKASSGAILFKGQRRLRQARPCPQPLRAVAIVPDHQCLPGALRLRQHPLRRALPLRDAVQLLPQARSQPRNQRAHAGHRRRGRAERRPAHARQRPVLRPAAGPRDRHHPLHGARADPAGRAHSGDDARGDGLRPSG